MADMKDFEKMNDVYKELFHKITVSDYFKTVTVIK